MAWQHTKWLQIKQLRIVVPVGTIHQTCQLLVRDAHNAAESVLPSSACAVIYGVMPHVHISNAPSSTNVIVELDGLLQASKQVHRQNYGCAKDSIVRNKKCHFVSKQNGSVQLDYKKLILFYFFCFIKKHDMLVLVISIQIFRQHVRNVHWLLLLCTLGAFCGTTVLLH